MGYFHYGHSNNYGGTRHPVDSIIAKDYCPRMATRRITSLFLSRLVATGLAAAATVAITMVPPPPDAAAADRLQISSVTTYTIDAATGGVQVRAQYIARNNDAASRNRYYYTGFTAPVPATATGLANTCQGVTPRVIPDNPFYSAIDIGIGAVNYGQQRTCELTYNLAGQPRSENSMARINAAYSGFVAWGYGDPGLVTVNVVVPNSFTVEPFFGDWTDTDDGTNTTYTIVVDEPDAFSETVSARNDDQLVETEVTIESGAEFSIFSWPGDVEWNEFVQAQVEEGVPVLEELIGDGWPVVGALEILESFTPYRYGYAGWFSVIDDEMEIGDELDQEVVLHELSHAWFNGEVFLDRWLSEGFAQVYSNLAIDELGGEPLPAATPAESDPGFATLTEWSNPGNSTNGTDDDEAYGYNASYYVVDQIVDEIGVDKMREVLAIVLSRDVTYPADGEREFVGAATGWKRFLDLVEMVGGAKSAEGVLREWVISSESLHLLDDRDEALEVYDALEEHGGEWAPPLGIRRSMTNWSFDSAIDRIEGAEAVLDLRDQLDTASQAAGAEYPDTLEEGYQEATGPLDKAADAVRAQLDAAQLLLDAIEKEGSSHGVFGTIGLLGADLDATLDEAREALATGDLERARSLSQSVIDDVDDSTNAGLIRIGIALATILLILLIVWLVRRRRKAKARAEAAAAAAVEGESTPSDDSVNAEMTREVDMSATMAAEPPSTPPDTDADPGATVDP